MYSVQNIYIQCLGGNSADQNETNPIVLGPTLLTQHNRRRNTYITTIKHKQQTDSSLFTSPSHPVPLSLFKKKKFQVSKS